MNVLFLTVSRITDINVRGIYTDLMRCFRDEGHNVHIVSPIERRLKQKTQYIEKDGIKLLNVRTLNIEKTNLIEKGIGTILLAYQFHQAIHKHLKNIKFDLIIYSTPPITTTKVVHFIKKRDGAKTYLLLKDIFPQNAVDLGMIKKSGIMHRYFRRKEKMLYKTSDYIGCMSQANVEYVIRHNPEINPGVIETNPNSIEPVRKTIQPEEKMQARRKYDIPTAATVFIYGGNLGKPQGIDFLISVLMANDGKQDRFFIIVGSGTEFPKIQKWFERNQPKNARLLSGLPKYEYDQLVQSCDVGMIFLDKRFTIPNFPSRLLSYLEFEMPVIAGTDRNTDLGKIIEENKFGLWAESGDLDKMNQHVDYICQNADTRQIMGANGYSYLLGHYTTKHSYEIIMNHFKRNAQTSQISAM